LKNTHYPDYSLIYPDIRKGEVEPSGGYVELHFTHHTHETARNVETAIFLAKHGYKVRLLPIDNTPGIKNPDAYLIDQELVVEFKHNFTPTASAIENELRDAKKQANYVLLHIQCDLTKGALIRGLRLQIHRAVNLEEVWIIFRGELFQFTPEEVRNETIEHKIQ
jgi:Contact-dependent growth inhibition CdiA C-terminal domain